MFRNRALQIQMVRNSPQDDRLDTTSTPALTPEQINQIARDQVRNVAVAVGLVVAGTKILNTVGEIALIATRSKF